MNKPVLELIAIEKSYSKGSENKIEVLKGVNLQLFPGETVALVAPSGAGKSTLLHIAGLLDKPLSGKILISGTEIQNESDNQLTMIRREEIGFVYQFHHLLDDLSVEENIFMPLMLKNTYNRSNKIIAKDLMKTLDIYKRKDHLPWKLSGGEKQRAALARAIINNPMFLFLDEPTGNLDIENSNNIQNLIFEISKKYGVALITATHDNEFIKLFDRVYRLENSKLSISNE